MRPEVLFKYFGDIESLVGVGPRSRPQFERLAGTRLVDLLWHFPSGLIDRRYRPKIAEAVVDSIVTMELEVVEHKPGPNSRVPYRVLCRDDSGFLSLVFFKPRKDWLVKQLPEGEKRLISGKLEKYQGTPQITHPDYIVDPTKADELPLLEPVYPLTAGLSPKLLRKAISEAVKRVPPLPEWHDKALMAREDWPNFHDALFTVHHPHTVENLAADDKARERLAYDELLASQLTMAIVRETSRKVKGRVIKGHGKFRAKVLENLNYELTDDQKNTAAEIESDMASSQSMLRLVQGDVGSGKTIVALLSMLIAVEAGCQAAMLAPTEILSRQHMANLKPLADAAGIRIEILTGRNKGKAREAILVDLAAGEIDILIGTHAIIQDDITFKNLALAVIDEQHRFGVHQRLALSKKGRGVDVLVMTATPIPRTLTLTAYGDMDVSRIVEKPPGRKPIDTRVISLERLGQVADGVKRAVTSGARAYWVCPLVEESEVLDMAAAEERYTHLKQIFGERVGLVHGRMKAAEKDAVMASFADGELDVLVATTVIEVGVDVPEATLMVIEHAERFGLSQLHQLRGRVGRGAGKSTCMLLRAPKIGEVAHERLDIMRQSEDGFAIAEKDLELRGAGEVLGTKQSGLPEMKIADIAVHSHLIAMANGDARLIASKDLELKGERGEALRVLLYLFERDTALKFLKSG